MFLVLGCTERSKQEPLGSSENPIKFFLLPSVEHTVLEESGRAIKSFLEANTPYKFKVSVPLNYIAVVEAFGSKRADIASLNTFGYWLARNKYAVEPLLTVERAGEATYRAAFIARADSNIKQVNDLKGKRFAFVDPTSTSGYILPKEYFQREKIQLGQTVFAQRHDNVVSLVYQKQVDAGAIYYSPPINNEIQDARMLVKAQYPDIENKIKIIGMTHAIPNDAIVFRKELSDEIKNTVVKGLKAFVATPEGRKALEKTFTVTGFKDSKESDYLTIMEMFQKIDQDEKSGSLKQ